MSGDPKADPGELLTEMRRQYEFAELDTHMLVDGVLHLRCRRCKERPIPHHYGCVLLCDPCLDEQLARKTEGAEDDSA